MVKKKKKKIFIWRYRVSIPAPRRCERRALPTELCLLKKIFYYDSSRIRTCEYYYNRFQVCRLNHSAILPKIY